VLSISSPKISVNGMKRYKCIDIVRGFAIIGMIFGHILNWWLTPEDYWLYLVIYYALGPVAAGGFLAISGLSASLSYKKSLVRIEESSDLNMRMVRNGYLLRGLLILIIAFLCNILIAIAINDLTWIWAWFVLQTIGFSVIMSWPLLKTSKIFRLLFGSSILIVNFIILELLKPFQGQANLYGIMYHILFNPLELFPIIPFFTIFIFGTVLGDTLYEINIIENPNARLHAVKYKFIYPLFIIGPALTIFAIVFQFPSFFTYSSFSAILYAIGIICIIVSVIIWIEELDLIKFKRNYNFFYYYSYYSFIVYIAHIPLFFLFYQRLNAINIWIAIFITLFLITLLIRFIYKKLGPKASIKAGIGILSLVLTIKIEQRKNIKMGKFEVASNLGKLLKFRDEGKN